MKKHQPKRFVLCYQPDCYERTANKKSDDYYEYTYCKAHGDKHREDLRRMNENLNRIMAPVFRRLAIRGTR